MTTLWNLGGLTLRQLGKKVWANMSEDRILGRAAQLSFYFLLSLFPLLMIMVTLLNRFAFVESALRGALSELLNAVAPESASGLVDGVSQHISEGLSGGGLSFGLLILFWAASSGMVAIMNALNLAYGVDESRSWWKRRLVAIGLMIALMVLITMALTLTVYGGEIAQAIAAGLGLGSTLTTMLWIVEWPLAVAFVLLVFNLLYLYAPNIKHRDWHWLMPGTVVAVGLWFIASYVFQLYVSNFGTYNMVYGSFGAVIVLLLWFYISGIAILVGAEVNSQLEIAGVQET